MFESLQEGLNTAFRSLRGKAKLTEANMRESLGEVQKALLEADVSFGVVKEFIGRVAEEAVGDRVLKSLDPAQHVVGLVHQELIQLMGPVDHSLGLTGELPVLLMCGLQGSGKTTTCGKLAARLKRENRKPMLVAADLQRPAAIQQLHVLGEQVGVPVFSQQGIDDPVAVCQAALKQARLQDVDCILVDTAGRLHIDEELMQQLQRIDRRVQPKQILLVVDGMTGQDAVNSAKAFNEALELDGLVMTKLDGDARGGAALSVKSVAGVPIKFIGVGEQIDALEEFHPDRMAGRILGMGDMVTLFEQAQHKLDQEEMAEAQERLAAGQFTLDDFKKQLLQTRRLGPLNKVMGMIPGMGGMSDMLNGADAEKDMQRLVGIVDSMTPAERANPTKIVDAGRRRRIAAGAGVQPNEVSDLVKQFDAMAGLMKEIGGLGMRDRMKKVQELARGPMAGGGLLQKKKQGTGKRLSASEKKAQRKQREKEMRKMRRHSRGG